jgi:hypothetical protein
MIFGFLSVLVTLQTVIQNLGHWSTDSHMPFILSADPRSCRMKSLAFKFTLASLSQTARFTFGLEEADDVVFAH